MRPSFKVVFAKKSIYGSREQCTGLKIFQQNIGTHGKRAFQTHTKPLKEVVISVTTYNKHCSD